MSFAVRGRKGEQIESSMIMAPICSHYGNDCNSVSVACSPCFYLNSFCSVLKYYRVYVFFKLWGFSSTPCFRLSLVSMATKMIWKILCKLLNCKYFLLNTIYTVKHVELPAILFLPTVLGKENKKHVWTYKC